jgi:hypothetical protein
MTRLFPAYEVSVKKEAGMGAIGPEIGNAILFGRNLCKSQKQHF